MLDLQSFQLDVGDPLPFGWHFFLLGGATRRSELRLDGFPGFGVPLPNLGLPRLLLGGRRVECQGALRIGSTVLRMSRIAKVKEKATPAGRLAIIDIENRLEEVDGPALIQETQTYLLLEATTGETSKPSEKSAIEAEFTKVVTPDDTLLFQYSALGFNTHKIHLDRAYARDVEGLPDLVVNGGLATLLVTEAVRVDLGAKTSAITTRHVAPLYSDREMTIALDRSDQGWSARVYDDTHVLAATMELTCE
tara:strand:+ start:726 stop:1475 length:750 start_codon:yes stop_codon:yes gene_type:complete